METELFRAERHRDRRPDVRTDRHDENNCSFLQFCEGAFNPAHEMPVELNKVKTPVSPKALSWRPIKKSVMSWPLSFGALLSGALLRTCYEGTSHNLLTHLPIVNPSFPYGALHTLHNNLIELLHFYWYSWIFNLFQKKIKWKGAQTHKYRHIYIIKQIFNVW